MTEQLQEPDFLSAADAGKLIGVSPAKMHAWAAARDAGDKVDAPPHYRVTERKRLWDRSDVLAWLSTRKAA